MRVSIFVAISKSSWRGHSVTRSYDWVRETLVPPTCVFIELSGFHRFVLSLRLSPWSSNWQMSRKNLNIVFLNCLVLARNWVLIACWGLTFEAKAEGKWALGQTGLHRINLLQRIESWLAWEWEVFSGVAVLSVLHVWAGKDELDRNSKCRLLQTQQSSCLSLLSWDNRCDPQWPSVIAESPWCSVILGFVLPIYF